MESSWWTLWNNQLGQKIYHLHTCHWEKSKTHSKAHQGTCLNWGEKYKLSFLSSSNSMGRKYKGGTLMIHFQFQRIEGRPSHFFREMQIWNLRKAWRSKLKNAGRWNNNRGGPKGKKDSPISPAMGQILAASFAALTRAVYKAPTDPWSELTLRQTEPTALKTERKPLWKPVLH